MRYLLLAAALLSAVALPASAQEGKSSRTGQAKAEAPAPPPVPKDPAVTTASFGDWILRCAVGPQVPPSRSCEVQQALSIEGQAAPFAQVAIGRVASGGPIMATLVLPNNVTVTAAAAVSVVKDDAEPLKVGWVRCLPSACFASAEAGEDFVERLRAAKDPLQFTFVDGTGRPIIVPFSARGLPEALDALAQEP